jgi:hypothetical protein
MDISPEHSTKPNAAMVSNDHISGDSCVFSDKAILPDPGYFPRKWYDESHNLKGMLYCEANISIPLKNRTTRF